MDFSSTFETHLHIKNTKQESELVKNTHSTYREPDENEKHLCYKYKITPIDLMIIKEHLNLGIEKKAPDKLKKDEIKPDDTFNKLENYLKSLKINES
jgi:hypothetical protein